MNERTAIRARAILNRIKDLEDSNDRIKCSFTVMSAKPRHAIAMLTYEWWEKAEDGSNVRGQSRPGFDMDTMDRILKGIFLENKNEIETLREELRKLK